MTRWLLTLALAALTVGCAQPRHGLDSCPAVPAGRETVQSLRYRVRTDAGRPAAQEVDRFMERAAVLWAPLLGVPDPRTLPLEVQLYCDPADLVRVLANRHLTVEATGVYLPAPSPAIHVACQGSEPGHPYRTLLHEGTHQFIHFGAGFREPGSTAAAPPRLALPLWLNEGLACYFEAAYVTPDLLQPGRPDPSRLRELQTALQDGKVPPLDQLLARRYGEPFSSLDYAVSWGVVYALMQESAPPWAAGGRDWLKTLVGTARQGWPAAADDTTAAVDDAAWWTRVTEGTRHSFTALLAGYGMNLRTWEDQWREWLLAHP